MSLNNIDIATELLEKIGGYIIADDTHRWVDTDGFYEVQFTLVLKEIEIYLGTVSGDSELQEAWSENNPQIVYNAADMLNTVSDIADVIDTLNTFISATYNKNDYRFTTTNLKYQYFYK